VLAADFMEFLAPVHWPPEARAGFCWLPENSAETDCKMKEGVVVVFIYDSCCTISLVVSFAYISTHFILL